MKTPWTPDGYSPSTSSNSPPHDGIKDDDVTKDTPMDTLSGDEITAMDDDESSSDDGSNPPEDQCWLEDSD